MVLRRGDFMRADPESDEPCVLLAAFEKLLTNWLRRLGDMGFSGLGLPDKVVLLVEMM